MWRNIKHCFRTRLYENKEFTTLPDPYFSFSVKYEINYFANTFEKN